MKKVLERYAEAIANVYARAQRREQKELTVAQKKGVAYYTAAAGCVQAIYIAPTPEWVFLEFKPKRSYTLPQVTVEI
jgi:hypothetical protein